MSVEISFRGCCKCAGSLLREMVDEFKLNPETVDFKISFFQGAGTLHSENCSEKQTKQKSFDTDVEPSSSLFGS